MKPSGSRLWRLKYYLNGKERLAALGKYPTTSLRMAREKCDEIRQQINAGIDPSIKRISERTAQADTFEAIAREFLKLQFGDTGTNAPSPAESSQPQRATTKATRTSRARRGKQVSEHTVATALRRLEMHVFKFLGDRPIRAITAPELLAVLRRIESRGTYAVTHRIRAICGRVFRFAIATGRAERDVAAE